MIAAIPFMNLPPLGLKELLHTLHHIYIPKSKKKGKELCITQFFKGVTRKRHVSLLLPFCCEEMSHKSISSYKRLGNRFPR